MTLIRELIHVPEKIFKGDFVLNLSAGVTQPQQTVDSYVVTPQLGVCFRDALKFIQSALDSRSSKAAYLHGSFGAGKSHFMAILYLLLHHDAAARTREELAPICEENAWADGRKFLLVPYHMIGATSLESAILDGYVKYVSERHPGAPLPAVYKAEALFDNARGYRRDVGDATFFARLSASAGGSGWGKLATGWDAESFERAVAAPPLHADRLRLVGDLVTHIFPAFKSAADGKTEMHVSLDEGLSILSQHAKALGYDALILFLDELILWLASHAADLTFVHREGQKLAKLVEATSPDRPIPIVSFVARQRDLRELVGEHVTGADQLNFSDALKHWEGRFHKIALEDRNLPVIAEKRILKPLDPDAKKRMDEAFAQTTKVRQEIMNVLLTSHATPETFRKVYPFSPALIETLVAVSSVLQRERTALRVMLELLVRQRDTLELGQVIPVGDLFDIVAHGEDAFSDVMRASFENAKRLYHEKLRPMLEEQYEVVPDREADDPETLRRLQAFRNDDRLVKTLLLSALVPEVESLKNLTALRLAALNHGTIKSPIPNQEAQIVLQRVRKWAARVGEIRLGTDEANPVISVQLSGIDTEAILEKAAADDNVGNRRRLIRQILFENMGIADRDELFWTHELIWRGTRRVIQVLYANVRELPDDGLRSDGGWKLIIDWPFDEGYSPAADASRIDDFEAENPDPPARTLVWLPSFLSSNAQRDLGTLVRLEYVLASNDRFEGVASHLSVQDRVTARTLLDNQRSALRGRFLGYLQAAYGLDAPQSDAIDAGYGMSVADHFRSLYPGFSPRPPATGSFKTALQELLDQALSFQFPAHPRFEADGEIRAARLKTAWQEVQRAIQSSDGRIHVEEKNRAMLRQIAGPLRLGTMHENHFLLEQHWRQHFNRKIAERKASHVTVADLYAWMDEPQPTGLPDPIRNLVVCAFAEQENRTFHQQGRTVTPELEQIRPDMELVLQKLPEPAQWEAAVACAQKLLEVQPPPLLTGASLARFAGQVRAAAPPLEDNAAVPRELEKLMKRVGMGAGDDTARQRTARAALELAAAVAHGKDELDLVGRLAAIQTPTTDAAIRRSLKTASAVGSALRNAKGDFFEALAGLADERRDAAGAILDELRRALEEDEFGIPLEAALRKAEQGAVKLLARAAPVPVAVTPLPPRVKGPGVIHTQQLTRMDAAQARAILAEIERELTDGRRIDLSYTIWDA